MPADVANFWHLWEFHLLFIFKQFAIWILHSPFLLYFPYFLSWLIPSLPFIFFAMQAERTKKAAVNLHNEILRGPRGKWHEQEQETFLEKLSHTPEIHKHYSDLHLNNTYGICYEEGRGVEAFTIWPEVPQKFKLHTKDFSEHLGKVRRHGECCYSFGSANKWTVY